MPSASRISELAVIIAENTAIVDEYLTSNGLPTPSFEVNGPAVIPIPPQELNVLAAQETVIGSTQELHDLMKGPTEMLMGIGVINPNDVLGLHAIYRYKIFSTFPLDQEATFAAVSAACGLNEIDLRRILRHTMTNHIFQERNGKVAHTAATKVLAQNEKMQDIIGIMTEEMLPGATRTVDALQKYGHAQAPHECGYALGHNTDKGLYDYLSQVPERARRYAGAMSGFAARTNIDSLVEAFDWSSARLCVDIGGGWGPVAIALAQRFPNLTVLVEDLPHVIADGPSHVPAGLPRVKFTARNIREEKEPNEGADVYLFRHVLHNFPDKTCVQILRNQVDSLKAGSMRGGPAHILIQDAVISEPRDELPVYKEKFRRSMDLIMLTLFGARERTLSDWTALVKQADSNMQVKYSHHPSNVLDVVWNESRNTSASPSTSGGEAIAPCG